jgi:hypothetical protein
MDGFQNMPLMNHFKIHQVNEIYAKSTDFNSSVTRGVGDLETLAQINDYMMFNGLKQLPDSMLDPSLIDLVQRKTGMLVNNRLIITK